jgi:hypothetical protein
MGDWSKNTSMALAVIMSGFMGWAGFHDRASVPDFEKTKPQYLVEKRPDAVKTVLREQFEGFQSQYRSHSFDTDGALNVTLDPNAPATQAAVDEKLEHDFSAAVSNKKNEVYLTTPASLAFAAIFVFGLLDERRRRNPRPMPEIKWDRVPPPPRHDTQ